MTAARDRSKRVRIAVAGAVIVALLVGLGASMVAAGSLVQPARRSVGAPPTNPPLETVVFENAAGVRLSGWYGRGLPGRGTVVLLHGVRSDRRSMLGRARFLRDDGYSVLLVDLQAHGESDGDRITFGLLEAEDAVAAVDFARGAVPDEPVAVLGTSLGGAACLLGDDPLDVDALVLEAVYTDVRRAVRNRLRIRFGAAGTWLAPLLTVQLKPRLGIDPARLRPIERIADVAAPVLIIGGERDRRTTLEESEALYAAAPTPKELWTVPGGGHVNLHAHARDRYERTVLDFLHRHMRPRDREVDRPSIRGIDPP